MRAARRSALGAILCCIVASHPVGAQTVTFNKDVAPILYEHCASCHRPGQIGPFSLLTFADARQRGRQIVDVTTRGVMPPWKPHEPRGAFIGDRSLSDAQIALLREWVAQGMREGDAADLPPPPSWTDGWQLGTPDVVVRMTAPYVLSPDGPDVFRTFVLPIPTSRMRFVHAIEFQPGNPRAVHHANIGIDRTRSSRRLDERDGEPGYAGGMAQEAGYPPGHMLGWTPGQRPRPAPDGMAWRLEPQSDLVVQLHMQPTGKPEPVQVSAAFFFTDRPPTREPVGLRLGSETIDIRAGERQYIVADSYILPVDVEVFGIQPHAHNLARTMEADAQLPDGSTRRLIEIRDWDFRWQDVYLYARPIALPKGTRISMRFVYDNSAGNARNPHHPPRRVVWGQNTSDEMGDLWIQIVPRSSSDLQPLSADVARKRRTEDLAAYLKLVKEEPDNPLRHDAVAMLYLQAGQADEAAVFLRSSLRLNDQSAPSHYNLGLALSMQRRYAEAQAEFEAALRLDPEHADAHNNLGAMLHVAGRLDEAAEHYRRAAALKPDNAEAHNNLGRVLLMQHRPAEALADFQRALQFTPDFVSALTAIGWVRATASDRTLIDAAEALRYSERAVQLTNRKDATALDALAAAYAAGGQFERAISAAQEALALAAPQPLLAEEIRRRLALYQRGLAYRDP